MSLEDSKHTNCVCESAGFHAMIPPLGIQGPSSDTVLLTTLRQPSHLPSFDRQFSPTEQCPAPWGLPVYPLAHHPSGFRGNTKFTQPGPPLLLHAHCLQHRLPAAQCRAFLLTSLQLTCRAGTRQRHRLAAAPAAPAATTATTATVTATATTATATAATSATAPLGPCFSQQPHPWQPLAPCGCCSHCHYPPPHQHQVRTSVPKS